MARGQQVFFFVRHGIPFLSLLSKPHIQSSPPTNRPRQTNEPSRSSHLSHLFPLPIPRLGRPSGSAVPQRVTMNSHGHAHWLISRKPRRTRRFPRADSYVTFGHITAGLLKGGAATLLDDDLVRCMSKPFRSNATRLHRRSSPNFLGQGSIG